MNLYFLTRVRDPASYTVFENVLSGRAGQMKVKEHEFVNLVCLVERLIKEGAILTELDGFYYGYSIAQIGKEFDLLKLCPNSMVLNIELKSRAVSEEKIERQLKKNQYYLSFIAPRLYLFTYVEETDQFYTLKDKKLTRCSSNDLLRVMGDFETYETGEIDSLFRARDYLVSPLNDPCRFAQGRYFLTQQQETIQKEILQKIGGLPGHPCFQGITGEAGTGKTLLLYDLAKKCAQKDSCCMLHAGLLCEGHQVLKEMLSNVDVREAKDLAAPSLWKYGFIFVDEAQRLSKEDFDSIIAAAQKTGAACVFSYDYFQTLSKTEQRRNIPGKLLELEGYTEHKLSGRIRSNREIADFIRSLLDLKRKGRNKLPYEHVDVLYAGNARELESIVGYYCQEQDYVCIALEKTQLDCRILDLCQRGYCTDAVIGQEFDDVLIMLDDRFRYDEFGKLQGNNHANPDYLYERMFFQAVSRTRERLCVVVLENEEIFKKLLALLA